eukprot:365942-Chlamydomonas_euryale.AAC.3
MEGDDEKLKPEADEAGCAPNDGVDGAKALADCTPNAGALDAAPKAGAWCPCPNAGALEPPKLKPLPVDPAPNAGGCDTPNVDVPNAGALEGEPNCGLGAVPPIVDAPNAGAGVPNAPAPPNAGALEAIPKGAAPVGGEPNGD